MVDKYREYRSILDEFLDQRKIGERHSPLRKSLSDTEADTSSSMKRAFLGVLEEEFNKSTR